MITSKKVTLYRIVAECRDNIKTEQYAVSFLALYNNIRENKETFLKFRMTYDSQIEIYTYDDEDVHHIASWLKENFNEVWDIDNLKIETQEIRLIEDDRNDFDDDILLPSSLSLADFK